MLRLRALGEADRIVTLFSRERGKLSGVARGARKVANKFGARLDFFSRVAVMLHAGKSLDAITSVQTVASIWEALVDPDAFAAASYVAEVIDTLCEPDFAVEELYDALCAFQYALARGADRDALLAAMDLHLLDALGVGPELDACARCGAVLGRRPLKGGRARLSPQAGGLVCDACAAALRSGGITEEGATVLHVSAPDFARLRELRRMPLDEVGKESHPGRLHRITQAFVEQQMGRRSRALAVGAAGSRVKRAAGRRR
ncbi:MAG: DNA repair protein RecO [Candidatus Eremiobacteraeota bacterium]|nr:DNA repair protein RecO [Candidatus Eremiobacteraeota bacterium]